VSTQDVARDERRVDDEQRRQPGPDVSRRSRGLSPASIRRDHECSFCVVRIVGVSARMITDRRHHPEGPDEGGRRSRVAIGREPDVVRTVAGGGRSTG
jgi:hypothetical protein